MERVSNFVGRFLFLVYGPVFVIFFIQLSYNMFLFIGNLVNLFLLGIIFLRIPQENVGLASFATKSNLLGSPSSAQKSLNIFTGCGIFLYLAIATILNSGIVY